MIDPDGKGGVTPFNVYCDMGDRDPDQKKDIIH